MRVLITNDDGFFSKGIEILHDVALQFTNDVWVFAPRQDKSGSSHAMTINHDILVEKIDNNKYIVDGTPSDSVVIALNSFLKDYPPDLVLSGINSGCNVGAAILFSGTANAAIEASLHNITSIAFSQRYPMHRKCDINWNFAKDYTSIILHKLAENENFLKSKAVINVNFPDTDILRGVKITKQGANQFASDSMLVSNTVDKKMMFRIRKNRNKRILTNDDITFLDDGYITMTDISYFCDHVGFCSIDKILESVNWL